MINLVASVPYTVYQIEDPVPCICVSVWTLQIVKSFCLKLLDVPCFCFDLFFYFIYNGFIAVINLCYDTLWCLFIFHFNSFPTLSSANCMHIVLSYNFNNDDMHCILMVPLNWHPWDLFLFRKNVIFRNFEILFRKNE